MTKLKAEAEKEGEDAFEEEEQVLQGGEDSHEEDDYNENEPDDDESEHDEQEDDEPEQFEPEDDEDESEVEPFANEDQFFLSPPPVPDGRVKCIITRIEKSCFFT